MTFSGRVVSAAATAFEQRSDRAAALSESSVAARELLQFAARVCRAQASMAAALEQKHVERELTGHLAHDVDRFLPLTEDMLRLISVKAPEALAAEALARLDDEPEIAKARLLTYWTGDIDAREDYLSRTLLRPYAEVLRAYGVTPDRVHAEGHCPFCGGAAVMSSRTGGSELEGAVRRLHCALCGNEWIFRRGCCPSCMESNPDKLPVYSEAAHPAVRIEVCETCRRYIKSIDLSLDARPIPEIDDLASVALDLWALEQGYTRIEPGLAGL